MKKNPIIFLLLIIMVNSCQGTQYFEYHPVGVGDSNPITIIKDAIEAQPAAQYYRPTTVEVTEKYIRLYMNESGDLGIGYVGGRIAAIPQGNKIVPKTIFYKHIGETKLAYKARFDNWYVEILDKQGYYFYWIWTYNKKEAERVIDALSYLKAKNSGPFK